MRKPIALVGAGRMGRGLAVVFAYAGHDVALIDLKERAADQFTSLAREATCEIGATLGTLARLGFCAAEQAPSIAARVRVVPAAEAATVLPAAGFIFEGVPEVLEQKRTALALMSRLAGPQPIIASTTSTILVDDLAEAIEHRERFLNAHWLNPPYLMPLVELSPGKVTSGNVVQTLRDLLDGIGKVTVLCAATPGYIVPRIQALAMNEAARMVEEGVASAEEIDKAVKYGFGLRFAVLGLLEFIDWGGGDILYYASRYLTQALGNERYAAPAIVERNMQEGNIGMKTGRGFLDYEKLDLDRHRLERLTAFTTLLRDLGLVRPPVV
ncbi:MAG: 3-hydroxybutyryl-CoA dehydrogenase [Reyranella sp.]|uniref:3-hydroxybutyryl-CoA dehydrogenase n=1 Tax=Reyranella sp. TaxID=1929291 RepID=UPI003D0D78C5